MACGDISNTFTHCYWKQHNGCYNNGSEHWYLIVRLIWSSICAVILFFSNRQLTHPFSIFQGKLKTTHFIQMVASLFKICSLKCLTVFCVFPRIWWMHELTWNNNKKLLPPSLSSYSILKPLLTTQHFFLIHVYLIGGYFYWVIPKVLK